MAYLSLYRKYRPQTFDEILGQGHVSQTLANAIVEDRVAHAYLFTGPRGTGKTSTARILAKALNCEKGPTPSPCGVCNSCRSITDGSSMDVIEMDAASHSKVDETREILAGVPLASAGSRKKVYVIDEVHMLTTQSFNALLKTLEEPPGHVVFILATTEAHKVLATIVSRTQRFDFRRVPTEIIEEHLADIAKREGIDAEPGALSVIARRAEGGVRDALSALDQLSNIVGSITETDAESLLGLRDEDSYFQLFDAIVEGDVGAVFLTLHALIGQGADPRQLALGVLGHARSLLLLRSSPDSEGLLDVAADDLARLSAQAARFSIEALLRTLELMGKALTDMRTAPNHRLLLEVALVRTTAPDTDPSALGLQGRIERLERRIGIAAGPIEGGAAAPPVAQPPATAAPPSRTQPAPAPKAAAPRKPAARPEAVAEPASQAVSEPPTPAAAAATPGEVPDGVGLTHIRDAWSSTMAEVNNRSKRIGALLNPSRPLRFDSGHLVVEVQSSFHETTMSEESNQSILADALFAALGIRPSVGFVARGAEIAPPSAPTTPDEAAAPAAATRTSGSRRAAAKRTDEDDDVDMEQTTPVGKGEHDPVELIKKGLDAEVVEERTRR
jgi:DNA polymerase-3 subunit gamma/tau